MKDIPYLICTKSSNMQQGIGSIFGLGKMGLVGNTTFRDPSILLIKDQASLSIFWEIWKIKLIDLKFWRCCPKRTCNVDNRPLSKYTTDYNEI